MSVAPDPEYILEQTNEQEELEVMLPDVAAAIVDPQLEDQPRYALRIYLMGTLDFIGFVAHVYCLEAYAQVVESFHHHMH